jgi:RNA 2',3'-cyclic 3'-phosphodiesterase
MRLFVAVVPPVDVVEHLAEFVEPRRSHPDDDLRWPAEENWHITLAFLGEVPDRKTDELAERLERAARRRPALNLWLEGAGAFPNAAEARVLWTGVHGDRKELSRLATGARAAANKSGIEVSGRRFSPHITLARTRRPVDLTRWIRVFDGYRGPAWTADRVELIESRLGQGPNRGSAYSTVGEWALSG